MTPRPCSCPLCPPPGCRWSIAERAPAAFVRCKACKAGRHRQVGA